MSGVQLMRDRKRRVTEILVRFSGPVDAAEASNVNTYRLATPGRRGSFTAKGARLIRLKSAVYDGASDTVALIPKVPFVLTKNVQLLVHGLPPSGLQDSLGRFLDGNRDGQPGSDATAILSRSGVSIDVARPLISEGSSPTDALIGTLPDLGVTAAATPAQRGKHPHG
jgi:hypothetical protein